MSALNIDASPIGALVHVTADNAYHGVGLVLDYRDFRRDDGTPEEVLPYARLVLIDGEPLLFWLHELEEARDEI
jgi:hypothetical protein